MLVTSYNKLAQVEKACKLQKLQNIIKKEAEVDKFFVDNLVSSLVAKIKKLKAKRDAKKAAQAA